MRRTGAPTGSTWLCPVQLVTFRVRVTRHGVGVTSAPSGPDPGPGPGPDSQADSPLGFASPGMAATAAATRDVYLVERAARAPVAVYDWQKLVPEQRIAGPAIVDGPDTTIVIPSVWNATVDRWGNVLLDRR